MGSSHHILYKSINRF